MSTFVPILLDGQIDGEEMKKQDIKKAMRIMGFTMLSSVIVTVLLYLI
jgi:hypothetical protein